MDEIGKFHLSSLSHVKWNKPEEEGQILDDLTHLWNIGNKIKETVPKEEKPLALDYILRLPNKQSEGRGKRTQTTVIEELQWRVLSSSVLVMCSNCKPPTVKQCCKYGTQTAFLKETKKHKRVSLFLPFLVPRTTGLTECKAVKTQSILSRHSFLIRKVWV